MNENGRVTVSRALGLGRACILGAATLAVAVPASAQNLNVTGSTTTSSLNVAGSTTTSGLAVTGASTLSGPTTASTLVVNGASTSNAQASVTGANFTLYGPNPSWAAVLQVGGNGRTLDRASVVATDGNLHIDPLGGHGLYLNYYSNTNTNVGQWTGPYKLNVYGDVYASNPSGSSWLRSGGVGGWYNETYGGGWYMADPTWIRSYNNKPVYMSAGSDTGAGSGVGCGGGLGGGYTLQVCGDMHVTAFVNFDRQIQVSGGPTSQVAAMIFGRGGVVRSDFPVGWNGGIATWDIVAASIRYDGLQARSDARLKDGVKSLDDSAVDKLLQLRPVSFKWKDPHSDPNVHFGFIAQEVEKVLPEIVTKGSDPDEMLAMGYQDLTAFLVKATQQLKRENDELRRRLEALERAR